MVKRICIFLLFLSLAVFAEWQGEATKAYMKNVGDVAYYMIKTPGDLAWFANKVNSGDSKINAILLNDIVFGKNESSQSEVNWIPIGKDSTHTFEGIIEGNNFTLYGLNGSNDSFQGLVGFLGKTGVIKNLKICNSIFSGRYVGSAASVNYGTIERVIATSTAKGNYAVGGIVGINEGNIKDCVFAGQIRLGTGYYTILIKESNRNGGAAGGVAYIDYTWNASSYAGGVAGVNKGLIERIENLGFITTDKTNDNFSEPEGLPESTESLGPPMLRAIRICGTTTKYFRKKMGGIVGLNKGMVNAARSAGDYSVNKDTVVYSEGLCNSTNSIVRNQYSGIVAYNADEGVIKNSLNIQDSATWAVVRENGPKATVNTVFYGNFVSENAIYLDSGKTINVDPHSKTELENEIYAWLLNTSTGSESNCGAWSSNGGYPILSNKTNWPISRIIFLYGTDGYDEQFTSASGRISQWPMPTPPNGKVLDGWYNRKGERVILSEHRFSSDDTLTAKFVNPEDAKYSVLFYNADTLFAFDFLAKNELVHYEGKEPSRDTTIYYYTFKGWTPEFTEITENQTKYFAEYDSAKITHTVEFWQHIYKDGESIATMPISIGQKVEHGSAAEAPELPSYPFCVFTGWDAPFDNVTSDLRIWAQCLTKCTIKFFVDNEIYHQEDLPCGYAATTPAQPIQSGKIFTGWDKDFNVVNEDMEIHASFAKECKVSFVVNDEIVSEQSIICGTSAKDPGLPQLPGFKASWNGSLENITEDKTFEATYDKIYYITTYTDQCYVGSTYEQTSTSYTLSKFPGGNFTTKKVSYWSTDVYGYYPIGIHGYPDEIIRLSADTTRIFAHMTMPAEISSRCSSIFLQTHNPDGSLKEDETKSSSSKNNEDYPFSSSSKKESSSSTATNLSSTAGFSSSSTDKYSYSASFASSSSKGFTSSSTWTHSSSSIWTSLKKPENNAIFSVFVQNQTVTISNIHHNDKIAITDILGKLIKKETSLTSGVLSIKISSPGVYIIHYNNNRKVIKIK